MNIKRWFRSMFIVGLLLGVISLFLDYYLFQAFDSDGELVVLWSYSPLFDWHTIFSDDSIFNEKYHPHSSSIPLIIQVVFIVSISICLYGVLFKDIEQQKTTSQLHFVAYTNIFSVLCMGFYLLIFPIMYLLPAELYVPFVKYYDPALDVQFTYSFHIGYLIQIISFVVSFPYALFYYQMVFSFKKALQSPDKMVSQYIQQIQEPLDLDKYIREEEISITNQKSLGKK
jgi:hypothetical protein